MEYLTLCLKAVKSITLILTFSFLLNDKYAKSIAFAIFIANPSCKFYVGTNLNSILNVLEYSSLVYLSLVFSIDIFGKGV